MTLDEQIEWLEQKVKDSYKSAQDYLSGYNTAGYASYSDLADKYQWIADSLKDYKELKNNGTI